MKILLLHPPVDYDLPPYFTSESIGLGYLASSLRLDGHEMEIFDAQLRCLKPGQAIEETLAKDFDCLGITASHEHQKVLLATVKAIRRQRKDALIVAGGYLPTLSTEPLLQACPELDFVVRGEGESAAREVFGRISRGEKWQDSPAVAYLNGKECVINPPPPLIEDLDTLPFPARDALLQSAVRTTVRIAGSRGCYHRCSFCCIRSFYEISGGRAPRRRSPKNIVDEMETIVASAGAKEFRFIDDDFLGPEKYRGWVHEVADEIAGRKLGITFAIEARADEVEEETLKHLKSAGLTEVFLGIESGVQRQLDTYNKHVTVEQNRRAIDLIRGCGIKLRSGFIMFDPYLTVPELMQNVEFVNQTGIARETISITPVPFITKVNLFHGVPLVKKLREDGLLRENGMNVNYVFKNPWTRLVYHGLSGISKVSQWFKGLKTKKAPGQ